MPITRAPLPVVIPPIIVVTTPVFASTSVVAVVAASGVVATLLVANAGRLGMTITNPPGGGATGRLFVKLGAAATLVDYSFFLDPGDIYNAPEGVTIYTGIITAILNSAGPRTIRTTELTA